MSHTTITVDKETKAQLDADRGGRPWDEYLRDLHDSAGGPLREGHIDDLADVVAQRTAEEVEQRLARRR